MRYEYMVGLRYLRSKRRQVFVSIISIIAVAGITVGVAALIVVQAGMTGVQDLMRDKIINFDAHLVVRAGCEPAADEDQCKESLTDERAAEIMAKLQSLTQITGQTPYLEEQAVIKSRRTSTGVIVKGIDLATVRQVSGIDGQVTQGSLAALELPIEDDDARAVPFCLGQELASELGAYRGSDVAMIIPRRASSLSALPGAMRLRVECLFAFDYYKMDSTSALISLPAAQVLFGREGEVDGIEVKTTDIGQVKQTAKIMEARLGPGFKVEPWYRKHGQLFAALEMEKLLSLLLLSLIILVAAFNIVSTLLMVVMEKFRDIAILKAMGATDSGIMLIFMLQGVIVGTAGALMGIVVGVAFCVLQNRFGLITVTPEVFEFSKIPMKIDWISVGSIAAGALALSFFTTLYPSRSASRIKPAESLRYE